MATPAAESPVRRGGRHAAPCAPDDDVPQPRPDALEGPDATGLANSESPPSVSSSAHIAAPSRGRHAAPVPVAPMPEPLPDSPPAALDVAERLAPPPAPSPEGGAPDAALAGPQLGPASRRRRVRSPRLAAGAAKSLGLLAWTVAVVLAFGQVAAVNGWWDVGTVAPRCGAAAATWLGLLLLARRIGLPAVVVGAYTGVVLALAMAFPAGWALSAASVAAASTYGLLAVVITRASPGLWCVREAVVAGFVAVVGAVVVSGYDVTLRAFRFRALVLLLCLVGGLALADRLRRWRGLGMPARAAVVVAAVAFLVFVGVVEGVWHVGQPVDSDLVTDARDGVLHVGQLGLRPVEALVGVPALVWGAARRSRGVSGWWLSAFGVLGTAGIATSLVQADTALGQSLAVTGVGLAVGTLLGLGAVAVEAAVVRRRAGSTPAGSPEPTGGPGTTPTDGPISRPASEQSRTAPLLPS